MSWFEREMISSSTLRPFNPQKCVRYCMHILYYSKACRHSVRMLKECDLSEMRMVCIDTDNYPDYITSVPTVVEGNQMYIGSSAFKWFEDKKNVDPYEFGTSGTNTGFSFVNDNECYYAETFNFSDVNDVTTHEEQVKDIPQVQGDPRSLEHIMNQRANDLKNI